MAINDDFFRVFGRISIFFATWDFFVTVLIGEVLRNDVVLPKLDNWTLGRKLRYFEKLEGQHVSNPSLLKQIRDLLPLAFEVSEKRNRFIHDQWVFWPAMIARGDIERVSLTIPARPEGSLARERQVY